jgi:2-C-methyl-D-erythritol 4-phosphate cytidylyltransferase
VEAHREAAAEGICDATDDAQLVVRLGGRVGVVEGSYTNFKVTTYDDFLLAAGFVEYQRAAG